MDKNREAFEAYFRGCAIANGKDEAWITKNLEHAEDGTYMRAPAYDGWCYWMAAKDFKAIDPKSKPSTSRNLCAYYYSFEPTGCDLIDSVLESVANAGSGYHHTEDWREEYDDGSSPLSNMQKAAEEAAAAVQELLSENKRLAALLECAQGDFRQATQIIEKLTPQAERLRWLRQHEFDIGSYHGTHEHNASAWFEHISDEAIDAAIAEEAQFAKESGHE